MCLEDADAAKVIIVASDNGVGFDISAALSFAKYREISAYRIRGVFLTALSRFTHLNPGITFECQSRGQGRKYYGYLSGACIESFEAALGCTQVRITIVSFQDRYVTMRPVAMDLRELREEIEWVPLEDSADESPKDGDAPQPQDKPLDNGGSAPPAQTR